MVNMIFPVKVINLQAKEWG